MFANEVLGATRNINFRLGLLNLPFSNFLEGQH